MRFNIIPLLFLAASADCFLLDGGCTQSHSDVIFVVDSSGSIGTLDFQKWLQFINSVIQGFHFGPVDMQVGMVTFSSSFYLQFKLDRSHVLKDIQALVNATIYNTGRTRTDSALKFVREHMMAPADGNRPSARDIVILLTDGSPTLINEAIIEAQLLRDSGALIIAVGVGDSSNQTQWSKEMASPNHAFTVNNFDLLNTLKQDIVESICNAPPISTQCVDRLKNCDTFAFDSSCTDPKFHRWALYNCSKTCGICGELTPPLCANTKPDCHLYDHSSCTDARFNYWAHTECPKFCNLCAGAGTQRPSSNCVDKDSDCHYYLPKDKYCLNDTHKAWMQANCPNWCNLCTGTGDIQVTSAPDGQCQDRLTNCQDYSQSACTEPSFFKWALYNCSKTCGLCGPPSPCEDKDPSCSLSPKDLCSDINYSYWSHVTCPNHCNICTGPDSINTTDDPSCQDKSADCWYYHADMCTAASSHTWAVENCPKFCGFCGLGTPRPSSNCVDKDPDCHYYVPKDKYCLNSTYKAWMQANCPKFCNLCYEATTTAPPTSPPLTTTPGPVPGTGICAGSNPCQNGGVCYPTSDPNVFNCVCPAGYGGSLCSLNVG